VLPVLGWFVLLPWTLVSGVGASLGSLRRRPAEAPRATTPAQIEAIQ